MNNLRFNLQNISCRWVLILELNRKLFIGFLFDFEQTIYDNDLCLNKVKYEKRKRGKSEYT